MRRWDGLLDGYLEELRARELAAATVVQFQRELDRWGSWLKHRRPRPSLEKVDSDLVIGYLRRRTRFRAKATVSGTMSILRGMGDYLVRQEIWQSNPLRWMHGPKLDWRTHLPRRIGEESMVKLWESAVAGRQAKSGDTTPISMLTGVVGKGKVRAWQESREWSARVGRTM